MAPVKTFLVAAFCAALVCASVGARELQTTYTSVPCVSYMGGVVTSTSGAAFKSVFTSAFEDCVKTFCETSPCEGSCQQSEAELNVPGNTIVAKAIADATPALATACAKAVTSVMAKGFIAGDCSGYISKVKASAKAQTMAKAISSSFASAFASVVGQQSYSEVFANISVITAALQSRCEQEFASINPGMIRCYKQLDQPCDTTNVPQSRYSALTDDQKAKCYVVTCHFGDPSASYDEVNTVVTTSAQAIVKAVSKVTVTQSGANTCTYDGQLKQCREFTDLCAGVCEGLDTCEDPESIETCPLDMGDWEELPNHDYKCQPICASGYAVTAVCDRTEPCDGDVCTTEKCDWKCLPIPSP